VCRRTTPTTPGSSTRHRLQIAHPDQVVSRKDQDKLEVQLLAAGIHGKIATTAAGGSSSSLGRQVFSVADASISVPSTLKTRGPFLSSTIRHFKRSIKFESFQLLHRSADRAPPSKECLADMLDSFIVVCRIFKKKCDLRTNLASVPCHNKAIIFN